MKHYEDTVVLEVTYKATNQYKNKGTNTIKDTSTLCTQILFFLNIYMTDELCLALS